MAHTKGPWEIATYKNYYGFSIWSPHGPCIVERWYQHERSEEENETMKANANLIAASPELYEALKDMLAAFAHSSGGSYGVASRAKAIAAIAKVEATNV